MLILRFVFAEKLYINKNTRVNNPKRFAQTQVIGRNFGSEGKI